MADNVIQNIGIKATADTGDTVKKLNELSNGLKKVYESAKGIDTKGMSFGQLRQGLQQAQASLRSAEKDIVKYGNTMGQMWRSAKVEEADAKGRIDAFSSALKSLEKQASGMKISIWNEGTPTSSEKYPFGKEEEYTPTQYKFAPIDPSLVGGQELDQTNAKAEETIGKFSRLRAKIGEAFSQENLQNFSDKMSRISAKAGEISGKMGRVARTVGSAGKRFLSAINPMTMFRNEQNKLSFSSTLLGKAFSRLGRMFRIMVTRMLIRGFISNIREGFQNIAQYSDVVNQKFSSIIASAKTLYNAFASAFTPLIEAIAPYVVKALDFITSAMNRVAEFMSALTGKSYYIKATKYNYNYAKSLDKAGKSAGKTAKKVKELKSATIGIDKLNVIEPNKNDNANSGSGAGAGNGGASPNDMFDTKPVSKKMKNLANEVKKIAKKLFDPIQKAWNSKGAKVLGSMKKMLGSIWETIKDIGRDFLTMWQQPATVKIFEDILDTVATIFDIVTAISDQFRKAWNKDNVGLHIFENLRDVFGIVVKRVKKIAEYTRDWAQHLNFTPLLQSIERYTKSLKKLVKGLSDIAGDFYETVVLGISKWVVEKGLPNLIQVFTDFNNKVNWQSLRKSLKVVWEGVEKFGEAVGQGLIDFIHWLADGIADLLNSRWFKGFLESIGKLLKKIKPEQVTSALKLFLKVWLGFKAIKFVSGLFSKITLKIINLIRLGSQIKQFISILGNLQGALSGLVTGGFLTAVYGGAIFGLTTLYSEIKSASKEAEELLKKNNALSKSYQNYLDKIDSANDELIIQNSELKKTNDEILGIDTNVSGYKSALDDIVDANGNVKKGYEEQAKFLTGQINDALGTNYEVIGNQVKGYKDMTSQLEKQIRLVTKKKLLENNAQNYYDAKKNISEKGSQHYDLKSRYEADHKEYKKWKKLSYDYGKMLDNKEYKDLRQKQEWQEKWQEAKANKAKYENSSKRLKKSLDKNEKVYYNYFKSILQQEALMNAKTKDEEEKAIARFSNGLSDKEKNALSSIEKIAKATGKSVEDVAKKYTKNGYVQFDKLAKDVKNIGKKTQKATKKNAEQITETWQSVIQKEAPDLWNSVQANLYNAINKKRISMKDALDYAKALTNAYKNGKDISKFVGAGIFKNKKSVQTATNKLNAIIDTTTKERTAKIGVERKKNFNSILRGISKDVRATIPKEIYVKITAKLNSASLTKSQKGILALKRIQSKGGTPLKTVSTGANRGYILYKDKKGTKRKMTFANGGFPKLGSEFIAGEKGAEFVGNINGKTGVTSNAEITGIREEVATQGQNQVALLQRQNQLLLQILDKNTDVNIDGVKLTKKINKINARSGYKIATT